MRATKMVLVIITSTSVWFIYSNNLTVSHIAYIYLYVVLLNTICMQLLVI